MSFSTRDVTGEVSRVIRGSLTTDKTAGVKDSKESHAQVLEVAAASLVLYPSSVFSLSRTVANRLSPVTDKAISLIDDMLYALQFVGRSPKIPTNTTDVNNAYTALLSLESANSVSGRPELKRFSKYLHSFAKDLRKVVVEGTELVMSGEEARLAVVADLADLKTAHSKILALVSNFSSLLDSYTGLDLPTRVASTTFSNVRDALVEVRDLLNSGNRTEIETRSKAMLLRSLVDDSVVNQVASSKPPSDLKYRGPYNPYPDREKRSLRAAGVVTPAAVASGIGPWDLPLTGDISIAVNGGAPVVIPTSGLNAATLYGRNTEQFKVSASDNFLYVSVDPKVYIGSLNTTGEAFYAPITMPAGTKFGFKHLGSPIVLPFTADPLFPTARNEYPRIIIGFTELGRTSGAPGANWSFNYTTGELTVNVWDPGYPRTSFFPRDVGTVIRNSSNLFEIIEYKNANTVVLRDASTFTMTSALLSGYHQDYPGENVIWWSEDLSRMVVDVPEWHNTAVFVGPAVKASQVATLGSYISAAALVSELMSGSSGSDHDLDNLIRNCEVFVSPLDAKKICIRGLNADPEVHILSSYLRPFCYSVAPPELVNKSINSVIGLYTGETDSGSVLSAGELAALINKYLTGATSTVEETDVVSGSARTQYGTSVLTGSDFSEVSAGYQVAIQGVSISGTYIIDTASPSSITLRGVTFPAEEQVTYRVFVESVKITSTLTSRGSSIEVLSAPLELGLPTGLVLGSTSTVEITSQQGVAQELDGLAVGDFISTVYGSNLIVAITGPALELDGSIPSTATGVQFEVGSGAARSYTATKSSVDVWLSSRNMMGRFGFNESLDELDAALSPMITSGSGLRAYSAKASGMLTFLKGLLTDLKTILSSHTAPVSDVVDNIIDGLVERRADRASDLLLDGDVSGFFNTDDETASYAGNVMSKSREALGDLPNAPTDYWSVQSLLADPDELGDWPDPENTPEDGDDFVED